MYTKGEAEMPSLSFSLQSSQVLSDPHWGSIVYLALYALVILGGFWIGMLEKDLDCGS